jgi:hypothetical protein
VALTTFQAPTAKLNTKIEIVVAVAATAGNITVRFGSGINSSGAATDITFKQIQLEVGSSRSAYQRVLPSTPT